MSEIDIKTILINLAPCSPSKGPPLPSGLQISWPSFFTRGIERLRTEGITAPWKTISHEGIGAEIKKEIGWTTGYGYKSKKR
jgi:hypothetical protein